MGIEEQKNTEQSATNGTVTPTADKSKDSSLAAANNCNFVSNISAVFDKIKPQKKSYNEESLKKMKYLCWLCGTVVVSINAVTLFRVSCDNDVINAVIINVDFIISIAMIVLLLCYCTNKCSKNDTDENSEHCYKLMQHVVNALTELEMKKIDAEKPKEEKPAISEAKLKLEICDSINAAFSKQHEICNDIKKQGESLNQLCEEIRHLSKSIDANVKYTRPCGKCLNGLFEQLPNGEFKCEYSKKKI